MFLYIHDKSHAMTMTQQLLLLKTRQMIQSSKRSYLLLVSVNVGAMTLKHEMITQNKITLCDFVNLRTEMYCFVVFANEGTVTVDAPAANSSGIYIVFGTEIVNFDLTIGNIKYDEITKNISPQ